MAISYDHTIQTTLEKENIGLIIGVKGANLNKYIHDRAKKEYCDAMNQGNPNEIGHRFVSKCIYDELNLKNITLVK